MRQKIIFDVDGVLFNGIEEVCKENNIPYENITEYDYELMNLTKEQKEILKNNFLNDYTNYPNFDKELFEKVCEKYDVNIHSLYSTEKEKNLKLDFFNKFNISKIEVTHFSEKKFIDETDFFIEDKISNLIRNVDKFNCGILINQPYNNKKIEINYENIVRADTIDDVLKMFLMLDEERES